MIQQTSCADAALSLKLLQEKFVSFLIYYFYLLSILPGRAHAHKPQKHAELGFSYQSATPRIRATELNALLSTSPFSLVGYMMATELPMHLATPTYQPKKHCMGAQVAAFAFFFACCYWCLNFMRLSRPRVHFLFLKFHLPRPTATHAVCFSQN